MQQMKMYHGQSVVASSMLPDVCAALSSYIWAKQWQFSDFQFWGERQWGGHGFGWRGIELEWLQVSYYHRACEIRRQNNHTAQTVNWPRFNENTQNMHAKKSIVYSKPAH